MIETDVSKITLMLKQFALGFGMDLLGAIVILAVGWWLRHADSSDYSLCSWWRCASECV